MDDFFPALCAVMFVFLVMFGCCSRGCHVDESVAHETLEKAGFTNVEVTEHNWFFISWQGCSNSDAARFVAMADNPKGNRVEVYVCSGWLFKNATIRY